MPAIRIPVFDIWQPGYGNAIVTINKAGTSTKADVYTNEALSAAASNPQTLLSKTEDGVEYGKFSVPLYVGEAVELSVDNGDETGIIRPPITTLVGENASDAKVTPTGGSKSRDLDDILGDVIYAENYGNIGPSESSSTNTTTITAAINAAAAIGGGRVILPDGTLPFTQLTIPQGVILAGRGRNVTTLQSQTADKVVTLSGDRAGLAELTLDGVNLVAGSIGVYSKANDETVFDDVLVKRFQTGIHLRGGRRANWQNLYIDNCATGAKLHSDNDASGGANGDEFRNNRWEGGKVSNCTTIGVDLQYVDKKVWHNTIADVGFEDNTGTALKINGARFADLPGCWWSGNTTNFSVQDGSDTDKDTENTIVGLRFRSGSISGGAATFTGTCQDVLLDHMEISDVDFTLTLPTNNIVVRDCTEDSNVTLAGDGTKWTRCRTMQGDMPGSSGTTTDATATKAWAVRLEPGQVGHIEAVVIGNQRNGAGYAVYHIARPVRRPGSTLAYDAQTANFTLGDILTGGTSGAKARIVADSDSGATGTLTLRDITGTFQDNETITGAGGGSATVNGLISHQNAALLGATASITAAVESDVAWAADFAANGQDIEILVTGEASKTIEWVVHSRLVST